MKRYQIAILAVCLVSALLSLIENKPVGYIASAAIAVILVVIWRRKRPEHHGEPMQPSTLENDRKPHTDPVSIPDDIVTDSFIVAGTSFQQDAFARLGTENPAYHYSQRELIDNGLDDERVYEYEFYPSKVELVEDPENPHDSNAIKVLIDGIHVGYIKSGSCSRVRNILLSGKVTSIEADVYGGRYKLLYLDNEEKYCLEKNETDFGAKVHILHHK